MSTTDTEEGQRVAIDVLAALTLVAVAGVLLSQTGDDPRDWAMPRALNYLLIGVGAIFLVKGLVRPGATVPVIPAVVRGKKLDVVLFVLAAAGYVAVMPIVGFWVTSAVVIFAVSVALAENRSRHTVLSSLAVAVAVCVVFYVLMLHVFYVPLPEGVLLPL